MKFIANVLALCALSATIGSAFVAQKHVPTTSSQLFMSSLQSLGATGPEPYAQAIRIEGDTLRTWKVDPDASKIQVEMQTGGRPAHFDVSLWHGPNYTPTTMKVYLEDGMQFPLNLVLKPKGSGIDTLQVLNTGAYDFPVMASVSQDETLPICKASDDLVDRVQPELVQGAGAVWYQSLDPNVDRFQVGIHAGPGGRNVKFFLELLQGPNNVKQSVEFYASSAYKTPFYAVFDTPGSGYAVRLRNVYQVEFPLHAYVDVYEG